MFDCFFHTDVKPLSNEIIILSIDRVLICSICDKDIMKQVCICSSCESILGHTKCVREQLEKKSHCPYCFISLEFPLVLD